MDETYWEHYGWWRAEWAERLLDEAGPQGGEYRAAMVAKAYALCLDDERLCGVGLTAEQKAGLRLQAGFWRDVYCDLTERAYA